MLHLIARTLPAPLHRLALRVAHALRQRWWRLARPTIVGACVIARDYEGRVLLLKQTYGPKGWVLPGGGVGRDEDPAEAAAREFREETGCAPLDLTSVGISTEPLHGATNQVHVFTARIAGEPKADRREVADLRLFAPDALPADVSPSVARRLAMAAIP